MKNSIASVADAVNVGKMTQFLTLIGIAATMPFYVHMQWLTGPLVNAILIIILFLIGIRSALVACLVPSLMALSGGLLPVVLAPAVPFIMISNVIFVIIIDRVYDYARNQQGGYWAGVAAGSLAKFLFLFVSVNFLTPLITNQQILQKAAAMFSWPQLATALTGGGIAWIFLKWLKRF